MAIDIKQELAAVDETKRAALDAARLKRLPSNMCSIGVSVASC
jgi:hypothetical protein